MRLYFITKIDIRKFDNIYTNKYNITYKIKLYYIL